MNQQIEILTYAHTHEEIAPIARAYWEQEGHPEGKADEHWQRAEAHLIRNRAAYEATDPKT